MAEISKYDNISTNGMMTEDIEITYALLHTAQQTLSDLDKSVGELAKLVEGLKINSAKIAGK